MSQHALSFSEHGAELTQAIERLVNTPSKSTAEPWLLATVSANNSTRLEECGEGGVAKLAENLDESKEQHAFVRVISETAPPRFVLIFWCGEGLPAMHKARFTRHVEDARRFFNVHAIEVYARCAEDVTMKLIAKKISDSAGSHYHSSFKPASTPDLNLTPISGNAAVRSTGAKTKTGLGEKSLKSPKESKQSSGFNAPASLVTRSGSAPVLRLNERSAAKPKQSPLSPTINTFSAPKDAEHDVHVPTLRERMALLNENKSSTPKSVSQRTSFSSTSGSDVLPSPSSSLRFRIDAFSSPERSPISPSMQRKVSTGSMQTWKKRTMENAAKADHLTPVVLLPASKSAAVIQPEEPVKPQLSLKERMAMLQSQKSTPILKSSPASTNLPTQTQGQVNLIATKGMSEASGAAENPQDSKIHATSTPAASAVPAKPLRQAPAQKAADLEQDKTANSDEKKVHAAMSGLSRPPPVPLQEQVADASSTNTAPMHKLPSRAAPTPVPQAEENLTPKLPTRRVSTPVTQEPEILLPNGHTDNGGIYIVQFDYESQNQEEELSLFANQCVNLVSGGDDGWWTVFDPKSGKAGLFPSSYLALGGDNSSGETTGSTYVALYDYAVRDGDDLELITGDKIVDVDTADPDWWRGTVVGTGRAGFFPATYVSLCT